MEKSTYGTLIGVSLRRTMEGAPERPLARYAADPEIREISMRHEAAGRFPAIDYLVTYIETYFLFDSNTGVITRLIP